MTEIKPTYDITVRAQPRSLTPTTWQMIEAIAPAMYKSHLFGVSSPEQATAIMLKGYELGLGLTAAFEFINVIRGKPTLNPRGALALIQQSGELEELEIKDRTDSNGTPTRCKVRMKRQNGFQYEVEFSMKDAERAGIVKPDSGWDKYPANMLRWRAVGFCADVVFPDVIGGLKRADELGADITPEGDVIEGTWQTAEDALEEVSESTVTLDELVAQYGAEAVLEANGGKIPATERDLVEVAAKLELEAADAQS